MTLLKQRLPGEHIAGGRFSDIMDELFSDAVSAQRNTFTPGIDLSETDKNYEVQVHLPGMNKEDIAVNVENGLLTVSGERKLKDGQKEKIFHKIETRYGSFKRSFKLPDNIDPESVKAAYVKGILEITIAKDEEKAERKIEIT